MVNATPRPLYPLERPGTRCIGGWVGPRAFRDGCGKSRPTPGFDPRTVQPVESRYTDDYIPAVGQRAVLVETQLTLTLLMSYIYMERIFLMFLDHTQRAPQSV